MNDDELKSLYNASSTEKPSAKVDASIIAEAEQALNQDSVTKKTIRTGWRPVFATAASLTLVIALAFQMTPQQQEEWPENGITEPASSLTKARDEEVIVVTGSRIASDVKEAEPEVKQQAAESFVASPETAVEESKDRVGAALTSIQS